MYKAADIQIKACKGNQLPHHVNSSLETPAITGYSIYLDFHIDIMLLEKGKD